MKTANLDLLNTGLIVLSFFLAYWLPFELFLFSYAVLGPLHYLTEINWIRDKNYFVASKFWIYIVVISAILISFPPLVRLITPEEHINSETILFITNVLPAYFNACLFISIVGAIGFTVFKNTTYQYITFALGCVLAVVFHNLSIYHLLVGIFLPTVIHVYIFTILFMWYGNLKSKSRIGSFNVILMFLAPVFIIFLTVRPFDYILGFDTKNIYQDNMLFILNAKISQAIGLTDGTRFSFEGKLFIKIQIFIAFAYTYHYLNWFSKTSVIGWHKRLTQKRSVIIVTMWIASVALYFYNYKIGFTLLLFLSFVHVFMEFPLNILSIKGIGQSIFNSNKT
ncbi:hypothetical protein U8527_15245 [Kordia algicida OT-1]|uniref:Uncharacterized protein n=1 Tax=Kordia algicida OT-1 TaxID=391587 RepID=A9E7L1_9FLAO|nr:hypothetical protein [Kordia algicida]EDP94909.1 hypothetical protein KAOT1_08849 [Kordia algicida OT-1]